MPAAIPLPLRDKLQKLRQSGQRISEIARELKLSRSTVARYCKDIDADVELKSTPAAALSEQEVLKLRWLAAQGRFIRCGECGRQMLVDVTRASGRCHGCGVEWSVRSAKGRH